MKRECVMLNVRLLFVIAVISEEVFMAQSSNKNNKQPSARIWSLNSTYSASTLHEVADMLGLIRERVHQIEAKALMKIRKRLQVQGYSKGHTLRLRGL
jgi:hypothetical protein